MLTVKSLGARLECQAFFSEALLNGWYELYFHCYKLYSHNQYADHYFIDQKYMGLKMVHIIHGSAE